MRRSRLALFGVGVLVVIVVSGLGAAAGGPPASVGEAAPAQTTPEVVVVQTFGALPDTPGRVRARRSFDIPTTVATLRTSLPDGATVTETSPGFDRVGSGRYEWTGGSRSPWIAYTVSVNETGDGRGPEAADGRFLFADVGEWGLFRRPSAPIDVRYRGESISFARRTRVDGSGAAGRELVFVGQSEVVERRAHGQTFRLVVPDGATLGPPPEAVLDALEGASGALRIGDRDETVFAVAAPQTADWSRRGLQAGDADLYVVATEPLDTPTSPWLHEYVHTRQDFTLTADTRWIPEATATYYAALLSLEQQRVDFDAFAAQLDRGTESRYADDVLASPASWSFGADYLKGSLVVGDLDRRLRLATDQRVDLQRVVSGLNAATEPVDAGGFVSLVRAAGTEPVGEAADRFTTTTDRPDIWSREAHAAAFGAQPARISYALPNSTGDGGYRVEGPYRNESLAGPPFVLVPGERLTVDVQLSNTGGSTGTYTVEYGRTDEPVGTLEGSIQAGESRVEPVTVPFDTVGDDSLRIGEYRRPVTVKPPARPTVTGIGVDRPDAELGEPVPIAIDVENTAERPAVGNLTVVLDGRPVATARVRLTAGDTKTLTVPLTVETTGDHHVTVGNRTVTVTVADGTPTSPGGRGDGPGGAGVLLAIAVFVGLACRRR